MNDYKRLGRALARLREQNIAAVLNVHGTTGVIEDCVVDYKRAAVKMGTTDWMGTHVGAYEHGGAYWDDRNVLHYRHDNSPVRTLYFSFNHYRPELANILTDAFRDEGLQVEHRERETDCVIVHLDGGR
jgi:hypothetical protein